MAFPNFWRVDFIMELFVSQKKYPTDPTISYSRKNQKHTMRMHEINNIKWRQFTIGPCKSFPECVSLLIKIYACACVYMLYVSVT